jgi:hypothetical protein
LKLQADYRQAITGLSEKEIAILGLQREIKKLNNLLHQNEFEYKALDEKHAAQGKE